MIVYATQQIYPNFTIMEVFDQKISYYTIRTAKKREIINCCPMALCELKRIAFN